MAQLGIGVIGCGAISGIYLKNLSTFAGVKLVCLHDQDQAKADVKAAEYGVTACSLDQMLSNDKVDIVCNLTTPLNHYAVGIAALRAGKHLYSEKPLAVNEQDATELIELAKEKGLKIASAPDTVLGAGIQTCRKLIDQGVIGQPVGFNAFMMCPGHESWHPDPAFYYATGGGPLFDMGPYYLSALVNLLGPVVEVSGFVATTFTERTITSAPKQGEKIKIETPTHLVTALRMRSKVLGQLTTSFDTMSPTSLPPIEIYGTEGSMRVPDPNGFGGDVEILKKGSTEWVTAPLEFSYPDNKRGLGVLDLALAVRENCEPRASGLVALHCVQVMHAAHATDQLGQTIPVPPVDRPQPMPESGLEA